MKNYLFFTVVLITSSSVALSQNLFRGIVIDSATFEELPGVMIQVKGTERRTISFTNGHFTIGATSQESLIFTMLGYQPVELPLRFEEDVLLIRMSEQIRILDEVTIKATRLYPNEILNRTKVAPKRMTALEGITSPIDYFWKLEREKRKLARVIEENNMAQTYLQVITDPVVKDIIMKAYGITELIYYEQLAVFNQQKASISNSTDPEEIMESLHAFFQAFINIR